MSPKAFFLCLLYFSCSGSDAFATKKDPSGCSRVILVDTDVPFDPFESLSGNEETLVQKHTDGSYSVILFSKYSRVTVATYSPQVDPKDGSISYTVVSFDPKLSIPPSSPHPPISRQWIQETNQNQRADEFKTPRLPIHPMLAKHFTITQEVFLKWLAFTTSELPAYASHDEVKVARCLAILNSPNIEVVFERVYEKKSLPLPRVLLEENLTSRMQYNKESEEETALVTLLDAYRIVHQSGFPTEISTFEKRIAQWQQRWLQTQI